MPGRGYKRPKNKRIDRQTRNSGLGTLRKLLKATGNEFAVQPTAGFLSQIAGADDYGNVGFNPFHNIMLDIKGDKDPKKKRRLGLVDETLAIPTLVELLGFEAPQFATDAAERTDFLHNAIRDDMGIDEPEGLYENAGESLGMMLGQLPIPSKKKAAVVLGAGSKIKALLKKIAGSAPEFFSPTVAPKASNYASGSAFGGVLGSLGDEPEEQDYAEGGMVIDQTSLMRIPTPRITTADGLRDFIARSRAAPPVSPEQERQNRFLTSIPSPEALNRNRINRRRDPQSLFDYGTQGETEYYGADLTQIPLNLREDLTAEQKQAIQNGELFLNEDARLPVRRLPSGNSGISRLPRQGGNPLNNAILNLRDRLNRGSPIGLADGGQVMDDQQAEQMAEQLALLVSKYRQS